MLVPSVPQSLGVRVLTSVNGVKISSAKVLNTPLLLLEPARLVHCPRPGQVANSLTPHTRPYKSGLAGPWTMDGP